MFMAKKWLGTKLAPMFLCALLTAVWIPCGSYHVSAQKQSPIKVFVDTARIQFSVDPMVKNGTTLVQLRPLFEALGITMKWDGGKRIVTGQKTGLTFALQIDSVDAKINGKKIKLTEAARIVNGNTVVPLRFIGEATDALVHWDREYNEIAIYTDQLLKSFGLTKEEAKQLLNTPSFPIQESTGLSGMYYSVSLDIANYCGGGFCFNYYTFLPDGKVFIGEPIDGGPERIDCSRQSCHAYVLEQGVIIFDRELQFAFEKREDKLIIGDQEFMPVRPFKNKQRMSGLYENISTYGSTLGNAMIAGQILLKEDGSYLSGKIRMGTDFNYTLEQGGYASSSKESGTYEITGNTITFKNDAGDQSSLFIVDLGENDGVHYLLIGGRMYKLNNNP